MPSYCHDSTISYHEKGFPRVQLDLADLLWKT